jgi:outer membrane protein TolC
VLVIRFLTAQGKRAWCFMAVSLLLAVASGCAAPRAAETAGNTTAARQLPRSPGSLKDFGREDPERIPATCQSGVQGQNEAGSDSGEFLLDNVSQETLSNSAVQQTGGFEGEPASPLPVTEVIASIHKSFPLLEAACSEYQIAEGNQTAASGAFDTRLRAASENGPLGFYETYRNSAGLARPLFQGGDVFGGYRVGRGDFQPWYLERETNDGGEFSGGIRVPLLRNREIDDRRAELWKRNYELERVQPNVRQQLILFVRDGSVVYWEWIAAGRRYEIGKQALLLAEQRNDQLKRRVETGDLEPPVLQDGLRAIAERESRLIDLRRKLDQAAIKLSMYFRDSTGQPLVVENSRLAGFPEPEALPDDQLGSDIPLAMATRPELAVIDADLQSLRVELAESANDLLPQLDALIAGSQDVGAPASDKRDKSPFELETGLFLDVPLQRRLGTGKSQAAAGKLMQLAAKRKFAVDKITTEVQSAFVAMAAARERLGKARESLRLAEELAGVERRKFELGESELLSVALREQFAIEAAASEADALLEYYVARSDYNAALARDWPVSMADR